MSVNINDVKKEINYLFFTFFNKKTKINKIKKIKESRKNVNYYFEINKKEYIFRVNINGINKKSSNYSRKEYYNLVFINSKIKNKDKFSKPVYFSRKGNFIPYSYILITYLKGKKITINNKNIDEIIDEYTKINKIKLNFLDRFYLKKENFSDFIKKCKRKEAYIYNKIKPISILYKNIRHRLMIDRPKNLNYNNCLIHGDLNKNNILIEKNKIKLIDFEFLKIGNPLFDLAKLTLNEEFNKNKSFEKLLLEKYNKKMKIDNIDKKFKFIKHLQVYFWLISNTESYLKLIFEDNKHKNKKQIINDILKNYKYFYNKKLIKKENNLTFFKKKLKIT